MLFFDVKREAKKIEKAIDERILLMGQKNELRDACEYALKAGGKRLRPLIVLWVGEALGKGLDVVDAAVAVELFHTSSLIADDLPIMDDEEFRRGKLTTHKKFGETTALLASYALIAYSYELVGKNAGIYRKQTNLSTPVCEAAIKAISSCAGLNGVMTGQLMDLSPPDQTIETIFEIIYLKTTTLFEASFSLGYIFGGGDLSLLEDLKDAAYHIGKAFQVADDIQDSEEDKKKPVDINIANKIGIEKAKLLVKKEIDQYFEKMKKLSLLSSKLKALGNFIIDYANE